MTLSELGTPRLISTPTQAEAFLRECLAFFGDGFHPDTGGEEYHLYNGGVDLGPTFNDRQAEAFDSNMELVFNAYEGSGTDPYEVTMRLAETA